MTQIWSGRLLTEASRRLYAACVEACQGIGDECLCAHSLVSVFSSAISFCHNGAEKDV